MGKIKEQKQKKLKRILRGARFVAHVYSWCIIGDHRQVSLQIVERTKRHQYL